MKFYMALSCCLVWSLVGCSAKTSETSEVKKLPTTAPASTVEAPPSTESDNTDLGSEGIGGESSNSE